MDVKNDVKDVKNEEGKDGYAKLEDKMKCASCGAQMHKDENVMKCENCGHETSATSATEAKTE